MCLNCDFNSRHQALFTGNRFDWENAGWRRLCFSGVRQAAFKGIKVKGLWFNWNNTTKTRNTTFRNMTQPKRVPSNDENIRWSFSLLTCPMSPSRRQTLLHLYWSTREEEMYLCSLLVLVCVTVLFCCMSAVKHLWTACMLKTTHLSDGDSFLSSRRLSSPLMVRFRLITTELAAVAASLCHVVKRLEDRTDC